VTDEPNNAIDLPGDLQQGVQQAAPQAALPQADQPPAAAAETAASPTLEATPPAAEPVAPAVDVTMPPVEAAAPAREPTTPAADATAAVELPPLVVPQVELPLPVEPWPWPAPGEVPPPEIAVAESAAAESQPAVQLETPATEAFSPLAEVASQAAAEPPAIQPEAELKTQQPKAKEPNAEEPKPEEPKSENMNWYILKVQSNREESIREGLLRRVAIAGLGRFFGDVIVPTEKVTEFKGGKKRVIKRKLYPGYLVVNMEINEDTWYLVRETPGIGDFTGATARSGPAHELRATPMLPHEVARIVAKQEEKSEKAPKLKIGFTTGERVKINEGTFENFEGEVETIDETSGRVTVMINIFGRSTPVELEYWQIETV
jgi:transcriptional antiterminator NusG